MKTVLDANTVSKLVGEIPSTYISRVVDDAYALAVSDIASGSASQFETVNLCACTIGWLSWGDQ